MTKSKTNEVDGPVYNAMGQQTRTLHVSIWHLMAISYSHDRGQMTPLRPIWLVGLATVCEELQPVDWKFLSLPGTCGVHNFSCEKSVEFGFF